MFKFRPHDESVEYWADNWLSNSMAYVSKRWFPSWCQTAEHYTVRVTDLLWSDCGCCLSIRFLVVGYLIGILAGSFVTAAIAWLLFM